jgi:hypothetical protein
MKIKIILLAIIAVGAAACGKQAPTVTETHSSHSEPTATKTNTRPLTQQADVPAFQDARSAVNLPPTLQPEQFLGRPTREAYRVVKEIPQIIAQLPCYCHCDKSFGHKSLHTCFVDTHASQCTVCVSEALLAYDLQRSGLTPAQIRERIIEQYSRQ